MKKKAEKHALYAMILATFCILILNITNLIEYLQTGYIGTTFSIVCFLAGDVCILIGWVAFFLDKRKKKESK